MYYQQHVKSVSCISYEARKILAEIWQKFSIISGHTIPQILTLWSFGHSECNRVNVQFGEIVVQNWNKNLKWHPEGHKKKQHEDLLRYKQRSVGRLNIENFMIPWLSSSYPRPRTRPRPYNKKYEIEHGLCACMER